MFSTDAAKRRAEATVRTILSSGLDDEIFEAVAARQPGCPVAFEVQLGRVIQDMTGALPPGTLLHAAAGDLIDDGVFARMQKAAA